MKILFVMEQGIGNMVMATPALQAIKQKYPDSHLTVMGINPALHILDYAPFVDEKVLFVPKDSNETYDYILMSIWADKFKREYGQEWVGTHARFAIEAQIVNPDAHESDYHMALVKDLGYEGDKPKPFVSVENADIDDFVKRENSAHYGIFIDGMRQKGVKFACLADTTVNITWERKRWRNYPDLAARLIEDGYHVAMIGGEKEKVQFNPDDYPPQVTPIFNLTLPQTARILQCADIFIGNDSGPAHMAGALGVNTYVIFGASRWTKNKPLGDNVHIIRKPMACSPCQYQEWWSICQSQDCMDIPAGFVMECLKAA